MEPTGINIPACETIFATPNPLLLSGVREVLAAAGMPPEARIVAPEWLSQALAQAEAYLVILDGQAMPHREILTQLCRSNPNSQFVVWVMQPTADLLRIALECGVHGLLSTRLPLQEAAAALVRIRRGERMLRFDADSRIGRSKPLQFSARERHVLMALAGGLSNAEIAAALPTTASTVKGCLARLFRKTGARNRRELAQLGHSMIRTAEQSAEQSKVSAETQPFDANWMLDNSGC